MEKNILENKNQNSDNHISSKRVVKRKTKTQVNEQNDNAKNKNGKSSNISTSKVDNIKKTKKQEKVQQAKKSSDKNIKQKENTKIVGEKKSKKENIRSSAYLDLVVVPQSSPIDNFIKKIKIILKKVFGKQYQTIDAQQALSNSSNNTKNDQQIIQQVMNDKSTRGRDKLGYISKQSKKENDIVKIENINVEQKEEIVENKETIKVIEEKTNQNIKKEEVYKQIEDLILDNIKKQELTNAKLNSAKVDEKKQEKNDINLEELFYMKNEQDETKTNIQEVNQILTPKDSINPELKDNDKSNQTDLLNDTKSKNDLPPTDENLNKNSVPVPERIVEEKQKEQILYSNLYKQDDIDQYINEIEEQENINESYFYKFDDLKLNSNIQLNGGTYSFIAQDIVPTNSFSTITSDGKINVRVNSIVTIDNDYKLNPIYDKDLTIGQIKKMYPNSRIAIYSETDKQMNQDRNILISPEANGTYQFGWSYLDELDGHIVKIND